MTIDEFLANPPEKIVTYPDPILHQVCLPIVIQDSIRLKLENDIHAITETMFAILDKYPNGVGLAAPQVGLPYRLFIVRVPARDTRHPERRFVFINPVILEYGIHMRWTEWSREGCLSLPGVFVKMKRPSKVKLTALTKDLVPVTITYEGQMAQVCLHEMDHLDGKLIWDGWPEEEKRKAMNLL